MPLNQVSATTKLLVFKSLRSAQRRVRARRPSSHSLTDTNPTTRSPRPRSHQPVVPSTQLNQSEEASTESQKLSRTSLTSQREPEPLLSRECKDFMLLPDPTSRVPPPRRRRRNEHTIKCHSHLNKPSGSQLVKRID